MISNIEYCVSIRKFNRIELALLATSCLDAQQAPTCDQYKIEMEFCPKAKPHFENNLSIRCVLLRMKDKILPSAWTVPVSMRLQF